MSNMPPLPTPLPPPVNPPPIQMPTNIPVSWVATISSLAGIIAFGAIPLIHKYFPSVPTLDVTLVQAALGIMISVAIAIHNYGWKVALQFFMTNIAPQLIKATEIAVTAQMQHNKDVGVLSSEDVVALKHARYARARRADSAPKQ